jgi:hypothetical protein
MASPAWPITILSPSKIIRQLAARTTAGTVALSGFTQRVSSAAQAWVITYDGIVVATRPQLLQWDAFEAYLEGGANPILVSLMSEGNGTTPGLTFGASSVGDTVITIVRPTAIDQGSHFSIGERLYRVVVVTDIVGDNYTLEIRPPVREDLTNATIVDFATPVCKCRLATDDEMILELDSARIGTGKVKFVEDPL